jgi:hypothetical protein
LEALKARNRKGSIKTEVIMLRPTTFRAFSAGNLQLILPGPMAQAITFRAFGAERVEF